MLTKLPAQLLGNLKGIVFDCDGVMFDSKSLNSHYYNAILKELGLPPLKKDEEEFAFAYTVEQVFSRMVPAELQEDAKKIRANFSYKTLIPYMTQEPGLLSLLKFLRRKKILCAVNTNRYNTMELILEYFGLTSYFFPVMTAAKVTFAKPHPEGLHKILDSWGIRPHEALFIGDTLLDSEAARRAGMFFAAYKKPELRADLHCNNFCTFQAWLAG